MLSCVSSGYGIARSSNAQMWARRRRKTNNFNTIREIIRGYEATAWKETETRLVELCTLLFSARWHTNTPQRKATQQQCGSIKLKIKSRDICGTRLRTRHACAQLWRNSDPFVRMWGTRANTQYISETSCQPSSNTYVVLIESRGHSTKIQLYKQERRRARLHLNTLEI